MDLADPLEVGPCFLLYTKEFYELVKKKLNPGGVFISQTFVSLSTLCPSSAVVLITGPGRHARLSASSPCGHVLGNFLRTEYLHVQMCLALFTYSNWSVCCVYGWSGSQER